MTNWAMVATLAGVVSLPLSIMVLYLRAIRADQVQLRKEHATLERRVGYIERDYAKNETLVREMAVVNKRLERLIELEVASRARSETETGLAVQIGRLVDALKQVVKA